MHVLMLSQIFSPERARFNLKVTLAKLLRFSFPLYLASVVSFLYSYYDRVVVLAFLPLSDVGIYDVAYKVFSVLIAFTAPFSSALFPYYGSAYDRSDRARCRERPGNREASRVNSRLAL
jgi:O-antigen/teichoic acid export membrane protein